MRLRAGFEIARPASVVWDELCADDALHWCRILQDVRWTSPRPFGVGTTREVVLAAGTPRVRERFIRWDEGHGYSFAVYEASVPVFRHFVEDYVLEPDGDGTLFTWKVAIEPKGAFALPFQLLSPVLKVSFGRMASDGQRYFAKQV